MTYEIKFIENPDPQSVQVLNDGIMAYAKKTKGFGPIRFYGFFVHNNENKIVGGCQCDMLYGCLYVGSLWVDEALRGQGYGTKLMQSVEKLAKEQQCNFIAVNTMNWEALDFYKKLGFKVEFQRHGFIGDSIFYFLRKDLAG
ncbi:MAG: GNAT family N-acetyltransferase [Proteobacteria bacterium]|nr:GNAT family N-acetyltransferase [Pseudomonadota bacterium]